MSEQQINPKVLSVASSCHYNGKTKYGKIVYSQMPAPRELSEEITAPPRQKLGCKSPRVEANFWCESPGVRGGGMVSTSNRMVWRAITDYFPE